MLAPTKPCHDISHLAHIGSRLSRPLRPLICLVGVKAVQTAGVQTDGGLDLSRAIRSAAWLRLYRLPGGSSSRISSAPYSMKPRFAPTSLFHVGLDIKYGSFDMRTKFWESSADCSVIKAT